MSMTDISSTKGRDATPTSLMDNPAGTHSREPILPLPPPASKFRPSYKNPTAAMAGQGVFVQDPWIGGCLVQCVKTRGYLTLGIGTDNIAILRADGTNASSALVFKADPVTVQVNPGASPRTQIWDPSSGKTYHIKTDHNNDVLLLPGPPVSEPDMNFLYEFSPKTSALLISYSDSLPIRPESPVLCCPPDAPGEIHLRLMSSLDDPKEYSFTLNWLAAGPATTTEPSMPPPAPMRISGGMWTPAYQAWIDLMESFFIDLPKALGFPTFAEMGSQDPTTTTAYLVKWWVSLTPLIRQTIAVDVAAVLALPLPPNPTADLVLDRAICLWRAMYEGGYLWDLLVWCIASSRSFSRDGWVAVDVVGLFARVSADILKYGGGMANLQAWQTAAWAKFQQAKSEPAMPPGFNAMLGQLGSTMTAAQGFIEKLPPKLTLTQQFHGARWYLSHEWQELMGTQNIDLWPSDMTIAS